MIPTKADIIELYGKRARYYDFTANLYYLIGFRGWAYRKKAVDALNLHPGDTVLEIGCGTGLNFHLLEEAVGPDGRIIGIDLSSAMLDKARKRIKRYGWENIDLVNMDAASYEFPKGLGGIISTLAITLIPEYDRVIYSGAKALSPGKRFVIFDLKQPFRLPSWLVKVGAFITSPFGVNLELAERHPWESVERHLTNTSFTELYLGCAYIVVGEAS